MDDKVMDITVNPQRVGSIIAADIKTILYKAYVKVIKLLPTKTKFEFYSEVDFKFGNGDKLKAPLVSNTYKSDATGKWADHVEGQIEKAIQSDETIKLKTLQIKFHFILHPAGGSTGTQNRDRDSILNKTSVNRIMNDDNICFWYALSIAMNKTNKAIKKKHIPKSKNKSG